MDARQSSATLRPLFLLLCQSCHAMSQNTEQGQHRCKHRCGCCTVELCKAPVLKPALWRGLQCRPMLMRREPARFRPLACRMPFGTLNDKHSHRGLHMQPHH